MTETNSDSACMTCGAETVTLFLDLGLQPSGNAFLTEDQVAAEQRYPLRMGVCESCWQVQLMQHLDRNLLFEDHPYLTGTNKPVVAHFAGLTQRLKDRFDLTPADLVVDIGCNDATLLTQFKALGLTTMGVEPSRRIAGMARQAGHVVANTFWSHDAAQGFKTLGLRPKLITAMSVFYHVSNLHDFLDGLELVMESDSVFVVQAVSLMSLLEGNQFDHFYHEHTCIHSMTALQEILKRHNLKIIDVEDADIHGGSFIAILARRDSGYPTSPNVARYFERELAAGLCKIETYTSFGRQAEQIARDLRAMLVDLKRQHKRVYGLGAPLKSSTFLNFADIDSTMIECLTEVNALKIGKLSPGKHIPVVDEGQLPHEPDCYVVFAWNYLDFLIEKKRGFLEAGGKFIVPFPNLRVIGADAL